MWRRNGGVGIRVMLANPIFILLPYFFKRDFHVTKGNEFLFRCPIEVYVFYGIKGIAPFYFLSVLVERPPVIFDIKIPKMLLPGGTMDIVQVNDGCLYVGIGKENPMGHRGDKPQICIVRQKFSGIGTFLTQQKTFRNNGGHPSPFLDGLKKMEDGEDVRLFSGNPVLIQSVVGIVFEVSGKGNVCKADSVSLMHGMPEGI